MKSPRASKASRLYKIGTTPIYGDQCFTNALRGNLSRAPVERRGTLEVPLVPPTVAAGASSSISQSRERMRSVRNIAMQSRFEAAVRESSSRWIGSDSEISPRLRIIGGSTSAADKGCRGTAHAKRSTGETCARQGIVQAPHVSERDGGVRDPHKHFQLGAHCSPAPPQSRQSRRARPLPPRRR